MTDENDDRQPGDWIRERRPGAAEDPVLEEAVREIAQRTRELAPEASKEEFLAAFGFGVCENCGRRVDDDHYTDCELVLDEDEDGLGTVLCHECLRARPFTVELGEDDTG